MVVILKKNANKRQIKKALKKIEHSKKSSKGKGNIAHLFGSNPNEVDGLKFQRKVRNEWR